MGCYVFLLYHIMYHKRRCFRFELLMKETQIWQAYLTRGRFQQAKIFQVFGKRFNSRFIFRRLLSNGTLYFSTVLHSRTNRPDEGMYQCVATLDGVGTIVSRTAELKVAGKQLRSFEVSTPHVG